VTIQRCSSQGREMLLTVIAHPSRY